MNHPEQSRLLAGVKQRGGMRISTELAAQLKQDGISDELAMSIGKTLLKSALFVWAPGNIINLTVEVRDDPRKWEDPMPGVPETEEIPEMENF